MDITPRKRAKIVTLREHTTISQRKIAETVGVSLGSVSSILKQKRETGNVEVKRKGRCGRKRKTTKRYDLTLLRKSKLNPRKTSEELKRDMDDSGVHVSSSTVGRRLLEKGRKARRPKKKQLLTAAIHFFVQGFNPNIICCSPNEKLREEHFVQTVKHPDKKMFWGCFSINGPGSLVPVEGMMNSKAYLPMIERKVSTELSKLHPQAIFQQDFALV